AIAPSTVLIYTVHIHKEFIRISNFEVRSERGEGRRMRTQPPFRVEHVGSFLRPPQLMDAVRKQRAGAITDAELQQAQDHAVRAVVRFQEELGLKSITDGEYRRRAWSTGFIDAVAGFGYREGALGSFKSEAGSVVIVAPSPYAKQRLVRRKGIATDEFAFLKSAVRSGVPKITMPSPAVMPFFPRPPSGGPA